MEADMNTGVELIYRERERLLDDVEELRSDLAKLEKQRKSATEAYNRARRGLVEQIAALNAKADGLQKDFERLQLEDEGAEDGTLSEDV